MAYTTRMYRWLLQCWYIQQGRNRGREEPVPVVGVIIDTNNDNLVDVNGDNVAAT